MRGPQKACQEMLGWIQVGVFLQTGRTSPVLRCDCGGHTDGFSARFINSQLSGVVPGALGLFRETSSIHGTVTAKPDLISWLEGEDEHLFLLLAEEEGLSAGGHSPKWEPDEQIVLYVLLSNLTHYLSTDVHSSYNRLD
ncbi:UNVERIFIED_CONTAM: hypothetical protein K2H54_065730 [Gekko kuhli]